jgi:hypothetical protein
VKLVIKIGYPKGISDIILLAVKTIELIEFSSRWSNSLHYLMKSVKLVIKIGYPKGISDIILLAVKTIELIEIK